MYHWYLRKNWIDRETDIEAVHLHYVCSPLGVRPDWEAQHSVWPMSVDGSSLPRDVSDQPTVVQQAEVRRSHTLSMPLKVWEADRGEWAFDFLLHYFFEIFQPKRRWTTETFTEEIIHRDLEYVDWEGRLSGAGILWSVVDWESPIWTSAEDPRFVEAFGGSHERCSARFYHFGDKPRFAVEKWNLMKQLPLPWRWAARIYAPKEAVVRQRWHIGNTSPGINWEDWDPHSPGDFVHFL